MANRRNFIKTTIMSAMVIATASTLALTEMACSSSNTILVSLNAVTAAAEAAVPFMGSYGAQVGPYIGQVSSAISATTVEMESKDTPSVKASKIVSYFAVASMPNLTGAPANVVNTIKAIDAAVQAFVASIQPATSGITAKTVNAHPAAVKITMSDRFTLHSLHSRAEAVSKKVKK